MKFQPPDTINDALERAAACADAEWPVRTGAVDATAHRGLGVHVVRLAEATRAALADAIAGVSVA